jgi:trans-2,3-dihydro-3-hydroxyanthranilate isomerase
MRRRFVTLDVFTLQRLAGNPLAVVFESDRLDTDAMQMIAREFNFPETVFVLPETAPAHRAALRIFTPKNELPFAGHPTVGAAVALARAKGEPVQRFVLQEKIGAIDCEVTLRDADSGEAQFVLPQLPARVSPAPAPEAMAKGLGLSPEDIGELPAGEWSAGVPFVYVPVKSLTAMERARPDLTCFDQIFGKNGPGRTYLFCRETRERRNHFHARMFAPGMGIVEDPATGSAAAALGGLIAATTSLGDGTHVFRIEQGYEMSRPSRIDLGLTIAGGKLVTGRIGGGAVVVTEGTIEA